MKLGFHGAAGTVTGSKYLLEHDGRRLLIDCGLFQGYKPLRARNWERPSFDPAALDAVVLTHAHLDHSGYLPLLVKRGFRGPVHCTEATFDLCRILLPDSGRIQEEDAERAERHGYSKHRPALPLYTERDAERALEAFRPHAFDRDLALGPGLTVRFLRAGHIIGSAMLRITAGSRSLLFTGDLGRPVDPVMHAPEPVDRADFLIVESTYGDRRHPEADPKQTLGEVILKTIGRNGVVLIPAFAVGRTQHLLWCIERLKAEGTLPAALPVYLNSPMAQDVTAVYRKHRAEHRLTPAGCEAMCRAAHFVTSIEESKALNRHRGPMVIIAGSGMATGGRILHHLRAFGGDPRNTIVFAGFQAGGTRGAALLAGAESVKIAGEHWPVRAEVVKLDNLSAHADYEETLAWLGGFRAPPQRTFVTHGEPAAAAALRQRIVDRLGWRCDVPDDLEQVDLVDA